MRDKQPYQQVMLWAGRRRSGARMARARRASATPRRAAGDPARRRQRKPRSGPAHRRRRPCRVDVQAAMTSWCPAEHVNVKPVRSAKSRACLQVAPVGVERHVLDPRPAPGLEAGVARMCAMLDVHAAWSDSWCCAPSGARWNSGTSSSRGGSKSSARKAQRHGPEPLWTCEAASLADTKRRLGQIESQPRALLRCAFARQGASSRRIGGR